MGTFHPTSLPNRWKAIGCQWRFTHKHNKNSNVTKYKARLIIHRDHQYEGVNYLTSGTWSPVAQSESQRTLLALTTALDYDVHVVDVIGAYLNADLMEEIYMWQPPGYDNGTSNINRLYWALYGLKQAGHVWNKLLDSTFCGMQFMRLDTNFCLYCWTMGECTWLVAMHVDNMSIATTRTKGAMERIKWEISEHFDISDLRPIKQVVGIKVSRNLSTGTTHIHQHAYIRKILERFGMSNANAVSTLLNHHVSLIKHTNGEADNKMHKDY
jgi:hypothetical protein